MQKLFQRRVHYIILTLSIFMVCVGIVYASHVLGKMRGFIGDVVVVMLLYTLIQSLILRSRVWVAIVVTLFAFCVECAQYFDIVSLLGLSGSPLAVLILGSVYDPIDLFAYMIGGVSIYLIDQYFLSGLSR